MRSYTVNIYTLILKTSFYYRCKNTHNFKISKSANLLISLFSPVLDYKEFRIVGLFERGGEL